MIPNTSAEMLLSRMQSPMLRMSRKLVTEKYDCIPTFGFTHQKEIILCGRLLTIKIWEWQIVEQPNLPFSFFKASVIQMKLLNGVWCSPSPSGAS